MRRSSRRWGRVAAVAGLVVGLGSTAGVGAGYADAGSASADTTPPVVTGVTVSPTTLDISTGDATATVRVSATDDLSGVSYAFVYWYNPSRSVQQYAYVANLVSGTTRNGVFQGSVTIPQYSETGSWAPSAIYAYDRVGNSRSITQPDAGALAPNLLVTDSVVSAPSEPNGVTVTAGNRQATVGWDVPTDDGNATITSYTVTASPGGATATVSGNPAPTSVTMTGLANGTAYTFTVTATNSAGTGPASAPSDPATPAGPPGKPTRVVPTAGDSSATVSWQAPVGTGGSAITSYTVTATPGGASTTVTGNPPATSATVYGLTNGTSYRFRVRASNQTGTGPQSNLSAAVTPRGLTCTIRGTDRANRITGTPGNDVICALGGNDIIIATAGRDVIIGGSGTDTITYATVGGAVVADLGTGSATKSSGLVDTLTDIENVSGGSGDDVLTGSNGPNVFDGGDGNDRLVGLGGNDVLNGGNGDDTILPGTGSNTADGEAGANTVSYEDAPADVLINTNAGQVIAPSLIQDTIDNFTTAIGSIYADGFVGGPGNDVFYGGPGDDALSSGGGVNQLYGQEGDDTVLSNDGDNYIDGGAGSDVVDYSVRSNAVVANLSTGTATIGSRSDVLVDVEELTGTQYADTLTGDGGPNILLGLNGADIIDGRGGDDSLDGGTGADTVSLQSSPSGTTIDLVSQTAVGDGYDTFSGMENVWGSEYADSIYGNDGNNFIRAFGGNDVVRAYGGNDSVYGYQGNDSLYGGAGEDILDGGAGNDYLNGETGTDSCNQAAGTGQLVSCNP